MLKTVFVVDDSDTNLSSAENALEDFYRVMTVPSAAKMFRLLEKITPDLILLDIEMPEMNGFDAIRQLKATDAYSNIPVIFLTSRTDGSVEARGFEMGAVDFITKPFFQAVLLNRIKMHLDVDMLIRERTSQLRRMQNGIVAVLADMVDNRDKITGGHIERTTRYIKILIDAMLTRGLYTDEMKTWDIDVTIASASLHDVGKIAISDLILNKPSRLTAEEFAKIQTHVTEGERIMEQITMRTGADAFLLNAKLFVSYHHERWDGLGYPYKLSGGAIPLQGRIMAIPDVYDALVSSRPYKDAVSDEEAAVTIMNEAGRHFDPQIADVFFGVKDKFRSAREGLDKR